LDQENDKKMSRILRTGLALSILMVNVACAPIPHRETVAPAINGIVLHEGHPVADAIITVSAERSSKAITTSTDNSGSFSTPELVEWQLMMPVMGDFFKVFDVAIQSEDRHYKGWSQMNWYGGQLKLITLKCDLDKPQIRNNGQTLYCEAIANGS
jgi:hypothetical protein